MIILIAKQNEQLGQEIFDVKKSVEQKGGTFKKKITYYYAKFNY